MIDVFTVVCMHLQDTADTLFLTLGRVQNGGTSLQLTGVHAEECQLTHKRVSHDLKGQCREGSVVIGRTFCLFVGLGNGALDGGHVQRTGHIIHDGVKQLLHAFVFVGSAADNGNHLVVHGGMTNDRTDTVRGDFFAFQIHFHQFIVEHGDSVHEFLAILIGQINHIFGNGLDTHVLAQVVIVDVGIHLHQVDDAFESLFSADGQLNGNSVALQTVIDHVQNIVEVSAHDVHLVDVNHTGDSVMVCLSPNRFGLRLDTTLCAQNGHRTVQHTQRTFDLNGEVNVARGINDIDAAAFPVAGRSSRRNGDAALLLLCHPVHGGSAFMGFANFVIDAGIVQNTLGGRRLTSIDMGHDTDVSGVFK